MSGERLIYPEWRKQNGTTRYPFSSAATLLNSGGKQLLEGTFLDAILYPIGGLTGLYLSRIVLDHETVTISVGNLGTPLLCSGSFDIISPPDSVKLIDTAGRPAGLLVSESIRFAVLQSLGIGTHEFTQEQTEFCASCCVPTPEIGVRGLILDSGDVLVGDVWIVGDDGVVVRAEEGSEPAACGVPVAVLPTIRVDIVGDPLYRRRLCEPTSLFTAPRFIKTLRVIGPNGTFDCGPDEFGEIKLTVLNHTVGDSVLRIGPVAGGLNVGAVGQPLKE